jgi:hypothetical protein
MVRAPVGGELLDELRRECQDHGIGIGLQIDLTRTLGRIFPERDRATRRHPGRDRS